MSKEAWFAQYERNLANGMSQGAALVATVGGRVVEEVLAHGGEPAEEEAPAAGGAEEVVALAAEAPGRGAAKTTGRG